MIRTIKDERMLFVVENQKKAIAGIRVGDAKIRSIDWVGEDRILLVTSQTEDLDWRFTTDKAEVFVGTLVPIGSGESPERIFANEEKLANAIAGIHGIRKIGGRYYAFFGAIEYQRDRATGTRKNTYVFDHGRPHLYRVDLQTLETKRIDVSASEGHGRDWLVDKNGEIAFKITVSYNSGSWKIANAQGITIAEGKQPSAGISLVGLTTDGQGAIYVERGEDRNYWYEIGQNGGEPKPFLDDADWEQLFFDPENGHLMGYTVGEDENERHVFFDKKLQEKAEQVRKAFTSFEASISNWTSDLDDVIVKTSGNGDSGTYYAVDFSTKLANPVAYERYEIGPERVGPISTFAYTASDGLEMDGILTLPPGRKPENLPMVMLPHGGPHSYDSPTFDWWAQAFASRGYAVFQPNFRGSTNRSAAFRIAGYGEWGRKMQSDKSDGLNALAQAGIIDPERVCIVGASYGGYAALAGVTLQQGIYRCAVAVAPVSDIGDMYQEDYRASGRDRTTKVALRERLGDPSGWNDVSPLRAADRADAPVMLIHGIDDTVVPYSHSKKMADKLSDFDKPHEFVTLEGEDHWLSRSETRRQMLEAAVGFVEKHNPAD